MFLLFFSLLKVLIPISLYVSMEVVKLFQVYFISNDLQLYYEEMDQPVLCRALNINEDLGQIKYVFSDKTGTLTENKMVFKRCTIGGRNFAHLDTLGKKLFYGASSFLSDFSKAFLLFVMNRLCGLQAFSC